MNFLIWLTTAFFIIASFECREYHYNTPQITINQVGGAAAYVQPQQTPVQQVQTAIVRSLGSRGRNYEVFLSGSKQIYEGRQGAAQGSGPAPSTSYIPPSINSLPGYSTTSGHLSAPGSYAPQPSAPHSVYGPPHGGIYAINQQLQQQYGRGGTLTYSNKVNPLVQSPQIIGGGSYVPPSAGASEQDYGEVAGRQIYGVVAAGQPAVSTQLQQAEQPQQGRGGPITHYDIVTVAVAAKGATQRPPEVHLSNYVTQSEVGNLDYYPHKQLNGDTRSYNRILTTCYPGSPCESAEVPAGHSQPRHEHVVLAARARISVLPSKCRKLQLEKAAAAAAGSAAGFAAEEAAGGAAATGGAVGTGNGILDPSTVRLQRRRLFPYTEVEEIEDIFN